MSLFADSADFLRVRSLWPAAALDVWPFCSVIFLSPIFGSLSRPGNVTEVHVL